MENNFDINYDLDIQYVADTLVKMSQLNIDVSQIENALYYLKAAAQNPYNKDYFTTILEVLTAICNLDYLED